jgi:hypothetical protein
MTLIDFDVLKAEQLYLHTLLSRATGFKSGQHKVDIAATDIAPQYKMRLSEWATCHTPAPVAAPTPAKPQISTAEEAQQKRDIAAAAQAVKDKEAATRRLQEYARDGLADTKANADLILEEVGSQPPTPALIDAVIAALHDKLEWKKPAEPVEVPKLPNGEDQLPLEISESHLRKASLTQLKDWKDRKKAADGIPYRRPSGSFGSRF